MDLTSVLKIKETNKYKKDADEASLKEYIKMYGENENRLYYEHIPKNYKELFKSRVETNVNDIYRWLKTFDKKLKSEQFKNNLLLVGNSGVGKSVIISIIAKELNIKILEFNSSTVKKRDTFKRQLVQYMTCYDVFDRNAKKMILIEELDSIISCDKTLMSDLLEILNPKVSIIPIIVTITPASLKKIKAIEKKCWTLYINPPTKKELSKHITMVLEKKNLYLDNCENIIKHANGDFRQISFILNDIIDEKKGSGSLFERVHVPNEIVERILLTYMKKQTDFTLFELFEIIMKSENSVQDKCKLAESDKIMSNLMFSENYLKLLDNNDFDTITEAADSISQANVIDKYINDTQDYSISELSSFIGFIYPSGVMKKTLVDNFNKLTYPANLNKHSFQVSRKRKLASFLRTSRISFDQLKFISFIIESSKPKRIIALLNAYGISFEQIDTVFKISNLDKQLKLSAKTKKDIKNYLNK